MDFGCSIVISMSFTLMFQGRAIRLQMDRAKKHPNAVSGFLLGAESYGALVFIYG